MNAAKQFIEQLQEGNTTEAIKIINDSIHERTIDLIEQTKTDYLVSCGFTIKEEKDSEEDDETKDKKKDVEEDNEEPKDNDMEDDEEEDK